MKRAGNDLERLVGKQFNDVGQDTRGNQVLKVMSKQRDNDHISWDDKVTSYYFADVDDQVIVFLDVKKN